MREPLYGEDNPMHVLTNEQVYEIRSISGSLREIGKRFITSHETVRRIKAGKMWPHLLDQKPS